MKIGIDISQMAYPGTGVAVYTQNLIENLLKMDRQNEYVFFFSSLRKKTPNFQNPNDQKKIEIKNFKLPPIFLEWLWNRVHIVPVETFTGKLDVFHSSDWLEPPSRCPKVTTIHDLAIFKYPETFVPRGGHDIVANLKRKFFWVVRESKLIVAVSEKTKKDIVDLLKISEKRIRVVHEAADEIFRPQREAMINDVKKKYGVEGNYLLTVGTREPRKNLKRVIEAFRLLISQYPNLSLVIAGKFGWGEDFDNLKFKTSNLKLLGYVPKEDLVSLYSGAACFVFPSLYEGFGLPVLEAMASGCPVVTSNFSSLPDVAGDAEILINPEKIEEIVGGIEKATQGKETLVKKGFEQAKKFSWEKTARETLKIYEEAAER